MNETEIVNLVCETLDVSFELVKGKRRFYELVTARGIISKILHSKGHSLQHIGRLLNKDHSTIIHYIHMIGSDIVHIPYVTDAWEKLKHLYVENRKKNPRAANKVGEITSADLANQKKARRKHSARNPKG
jgi:hypothetical protein